MVPWLCYVGARAMCGGCCGVAPRCPGKCAVWRGCGVWLLGGNRLGWSFRRRVWIGLWLVVGAGLVSGVWGLRGWCWWGGGGVGAGVVQCRSCVGGLRCPTSLGSASWCVAVSRAALSPEVRVGGGGECCVVWWRWVVCWLPRPGEGCCVWFHWGGWLLVVGHWAVQGCQARSLGRPPCHPQSVGRVG